MTDIDLYCTAFGIDGVNGRSYWYFLFILIFNLFHRILVVSKLSKAIDSIWIELENLECVVIQNGIKMPLFMIFYSVGNFNGKIFWIGDVCGAGGGVSGGCGHACTGGGVSP